MEDKEALEIVLALAEGAVTGGDDADAKEIVALRRVLALKVALERVHLLPDRWRGEVRSFRPEQQRNSPTWLLECAEDLEQALECKSVKDLSALQKWQALDQGGQAILAGIMPELPAWFGAREDLYHKGLLDPRYDEPTAAGQALVAAALENGLLVPAPTPALGFRRA